jgi:CubicO group peptidase (beta-lactamase class C family)
MTDIKSLIDEGFRGNILIVRKGAVLYESSSGFADLANEIPNTMDTRFATASAGKTFVAVGILQLVERGLIKLGDTLGTLLDIDLKQIDPDVTVEQLLNHTSGVPDYFDETVMGDYEDLWNDYPCSKIRSNNDLFPLFIDKAMMYPRGEKFQYNNTGYVLLAAIIENISGMDFDAYLKKNIFDVCGMDSTGYFEMDRLPSKCAHNYIYCEKTNDYRTNIFSVGAKGTGDGGVFVTAGDLVRFWQGLIGHKLISEDTFKKMISKQSGDGSDPEEGYYGYGVWIIDNPKGTDFAYMQGCDPGVSAIAEYNPDNEQISIALSNYGDNVWALMRKIRKG